MTTTRRVYIVGAGPGDPDLITVRGAQLLAEADLVIYAGSLVNRDILSRCTPTCRLIDSAGMTLEEQVDAMEDAVNSDKRVVRLHTGDPSLYGAISEQMRLLRVKDIDCEIIPGVSSLQGAAARLGIEYTVPGGTQTLICTRMSGKTPVPDAESPLNLAAHGSTMVLFLSADRASDLVSECVRAGRSPDTPAAWIYRATWQDEQKCVTTLQNLPKSLEDAGITKHALIVIGDCLDPDSSARSQLYHPNFSHGARS